MHHSDIDAHTSMHAPRATIGRHALTPAPVRAPRSRGFSWTRVALAMLAVAVLTACGGGGDSPERADAQCDPDTWDCATMYADFPFRAVPDSAQGPDVYTFNPAPRAGYSIVATR